AEGGAVAAGEEAAVVAKDAVLAGAAGDPVIAPAAVEGVILAVAEQDVVPLQTVDHVVARLAVDLVAPAAILVGVGGIEGRPTGGVVEEPDRPRDDAQRAAVLGGAGQVVVELEEPGPGGAVGAHQAEDVAVVARDRIGVPGVPGGEGRAGKRSLTDVGV